MKKSLPLIVLLLFAALGSQYLNEQDAATETGTATGTHAAAGRGEAIDEAFEARRSSVQVGASGTVTRVLTDDNNGDRHQRFVLELKSGLTVLVAHNIDLAPRIEGLRRGDIVSFFGEYEWNERGGVIHWTHHDPARRHADGWLELNGRRYE